MKKWFVFLLIPCALALLLLLMTAVAQNQTDGPNNPADTTAGPTAGLTDPPTEPPTGSTGTADDPRFAELDALFGNLNSWYSRALLCEYSTPAEVDLYELFYNGFDDESDEPTDEEWKALKDNPNLLRAGDMRRLPAKKMNQILTQYFGIALKDVKKSGFDNLVYLKSTDCYYMVHGDVHFLSDFKTTGLEYLPDGNIRMSYKTDGVACAAILKPVKDGYQILSNKMVGYPVIGGDILLKEYETLFADKESWYRQALICQYEKPSQFNIKEFFYNGFADESRTPTAEERKALENMPGIDLNMDLIRLPVDKMNQVLQNVFDDISLNGIDESGFEGLVYLESTNCYYHTASDVRKVENFRIIKADMQLEWGRVRLYYTVGDGQTYVVKVWPIANGNYYILSNRKDVQ